MILWRFITDDAHKRTSALPLLWSVTALCGLPMEKGTAAKEQQVWKHHEKATLKYRTEWSRGYQEALKTALHLPAPASITNRNRKRSVPLCSDSPLSSTCQSLLQSWPLPLHPFSNRILHLGTYPWSASRTITRLLRPPGQLPSWLHDHLSFLQELHPENTNRSSPCRQGWGWQCDPPAVGVTLPAPSLAHSRSQRGTNTRDLRVTQGSSASFDTLGSANVATSAGEAVSYRNSWVRTFPDKHK